MEPLGREYLLHEEIGRGAVAVVHRASSRHGGPPLAAKLLRPEFAGDRRVRELFLREEEALRDLDHPGIVALRDLIVEGGTLALVMDLVDGPNLRRHLAQHGGRLAPAEVATIAAQTAAALAAAHAQGVVHLDLKPENVLVVRGSAPPLVRITDFGVAVLLHDADRGAAGGTPGYTAPEIFAGATPTAAADVWSLGVLLVELITGSPQGDPAALPEALAPMARDCLAADPRARPAARQVAAYLRRLADTFQPVAPAPAAGDNLSDWAGRLLGGEMHETRLRPGVGPAAETPAPPPPREPSRWRRGPLVTLGVITLVAAVLTGITVTASASERRKGERGNSANQLVSVPPAVATTPGAVPSTTALAAPATTTATAERLRVTLAGRVDDDGGTLALSIRDGVAIAYVCDGKRVEAWLKGTAKAGRLALKGSGGSRLTGTFSAREAEGDITVEDETRGFTVGVVEKPSGLYRTTAQVRGAEVEGSWIVLPDGSQVGVLSSDGVPGPAPSLDVSGRTAVVDGVTVGATGVDADSGEGF
ncbi:MULTISPECIES: serine/threonine-protein kinase [Actinoplanes]|uniref:protein kinase domain-containing protein n=1 Tax=Actinoplanes TaxID=1865 RepID=UPI0005F27F95|nr:MULTISPECIES: serine/threonine-protein kinase [Actinoplanes]GLY06285.1 hypothetical protein Acsp01_66640 [Actinoplanes sp. NBRC 101535]